MKSNTHLKGDKKNDTTLEHLNKTYTAHVYFTKPKGICICCPKLHFFF